MKTKKELQQELEELENQQFYLQMKDLWNADDKKFNKQLEDKIKEVQKQLKYY